MMNHCCSSSNSQDHVMGTCTCGYYYYGDPNMYSSYTPCSSVSSSSLGHVDCTLSLGTPSTRSSEHVDKRGICHRDGPSRSSQNPRSHAKPSMGSNCGSNSDSFFSRRCCNCDTTSTPLWRNGPRGPKTLCNACGIRYKKEERRASAAAAAAATTTVTNGGQMESVGAAHNMYGHNNNNSWYYTDSQGSNGELRFMDYDANDDMDPFPSWRLNVADRTSLVHDFTR